MKSTMESEPLLPAAFQFVHLVKQRFCKNPAKYKKYTKIMRELRENPDEDPSDLIFDLKKLLASHQDLLFGLNTFLPEEYKVVGPPQDPNKTLLRDLYKKSYIRSAIEFVNKIHERFLKDEDRRVFMRFCEIMGMYQKQEMDIYQVDMELRVLFKDDPDLHIEFTRFSADAAEYAEDSFSEDRFHKKVKGVFRKKKTIIKMDLYEETLLAWETFKYELDMVFQYTKSTAEILSNYPEKIDQKFKAHNFRCIEELYGGANGDGMEAVEILRRDPVGTAKVMVPRLKQNYEQLKEYQCHMDKIWAEILKDIREKRPPRHRRFLVNFQRDFATLKKRRLEE